MYLRVLQFVALILISISYTQSCCAPSVVQGTAMSYGFVSVGKTAYQNMQKFYYDEEEEKVARVTKDMMGQPVRDIFDFSAKKRYVITNGTCNVTDLKEPFQKSCVPPSAVFMGSTVLGNTYDNMKVDNYRLNISQGPVSIESAFMIAPMKGGDCTMVGLVAFGKDQNGYQFSETSIYMNFSFEITDKSVFQPPKQCKEPENSGTLLFEVLGGFRRYGF